MYTTLFRFGKILISRFGTSGNFLGIDKSSASRRVRQAIKAGYLINEEGTRGKPMRLRIGDPMPEEVQVLPTPEQLERAIGVHDKDPTAVWM